MIEQEAVKSAPNLIGSSETLRYLTTHAPQFVDITDDVEEAVGRSGITSGVAVIFSRHTTAAVKINENEPELIKDLCRFLEAIAPTDREYYHNNFDVRTVNLEENECPNAHSHCQHLLLSSSESVPILDGRLDLGRWQRILLVELDQAKAREVTVQMLGA